MSKSGTRHREKIVTCAPTHDITGAASGQHVIASTTKYEFPCRRAGGLDGRGTCAERTAENDIGFTCRAAAGRRANQEIREAIAIDISCSRDAEPGISAGQTALDDQSLNQRGL